jgi:hypothetical protein
VRLGRFDCFSHGRAAGDQGPGRKGGGKVKRGKEGKGSPKAVVWLAPDCPPRPAAASAPAPASTEQPAARDADDDGAATEGHADAIAGNTVKGNAADDNTAKVAAMEGKSDERKTGEDRGKGERYPVAEPLAALHRLVTDALALGGRPSRFVPHMTVGQWPDDDELGACVRQLQEAWSPIDWRVDSIALLSRAGQDEPYATHARIWLPDRSAPARWEMVDPPELYEYDVDYSDP